MSKSLVSWHVRIYSERNADNKQMGYASHYVDAFTYCQAMDKARAICTSSNNGTFTFRILDCVKAVAFV